MPLTLREAIARFGSNAKAKLANPAILGQPEDQLRAPLEQLLGDFSELAGLPRRAVVAVGESTLSQLKTPLPVRRSPAFVADRVALLPPPDSREASDRRPRVRESAAARVVPSLRVPSR